MRKKYNANFKAQIVLEALREEKSISQIASENSIHPAMVSKWRTIATEGLAQLFADDYKNEQKEVDQEKLVLQLYTRIGKLTTELEWLQRKADYILKP